MEFEKYDYKRRYGHGRKHHRKFFIFLVFLLVMGIIFFTSIGGFSFTGKTVGSISTDNSVVLFLESTIPELKLDGKYEQIRIVGNSDMPLYVGNQKFALNKFAFNELILKDYSGKIYFDRGNIFLINGKASNVILNGIPISGKDNRALKVQIDSEMSYNSIEFDNIYLKEINYISSGEIFFGDNRENRMRLNEEDLFVFHFLGDLKIMNNRMSLDGLASKVEIRTDGKRISVSY